MECSCTLSVSRLGSRTNRDALPFCHRVLTATKLKSPEYPKELKTLGDHIRKRRLDLGLFQRQVAEQIGVTESTILNWESNATRPPVRYIRCIIRFLGYEPFPEPISVSEKLVLERRLLGLTQKAMAKRLGVDPTTLARWERGKGWQRKKSIAAIEAFLTLSASVKSKS